jgi:hypothetical protein
MWDKADDGLVVGNDHTIGHVAEQDDAAVGESVMGLFTTALSKAEMERLVGSVPLTSKSSTLCCRTSFSAWSLSWAFLPAPGIRAIVIGILVVVGRYYRIGRFRGEQLLHQLFYAHTNRHRLVSVDTAVKLS